METRLVYVFQCARLRTHRGRIIFLARHVSMRAVNQLHRFVQTPAPRHMVVNGRMFIDVLAVVNGRLFDFIDRPVKFVPGVFFLPMQFTAIGTIQQRARIAQIR